MGGAMIGVCPVCQDIIWERDDWVIDKFFMKHRECDYALMEDITRKLTRLSRPQQLRILNFLETITTEEE